MEAAAIMAAANVGAQAAQAPQVAAIPPVPPPMATPQPTAQAAAPQSFAPTPAQATARRVGAGVSSFLGAAAAAGQTAKTKATLG